MTTILVDPQGSVSECFAAPSSPMATLAERNRGGIVLRRRGHRLAEVWYCPRHTEPLALLAAIEWLDGHRCARATLHACPIGSQPTFVSKVESTIEQLTCLVMTEQVTRERHFSAHRLSRDAAAARPGLARLWEAWRDCGGIGTHALLDTAREVSGARFLVVDPRDAATRLVLSAIGQSYTLYGRGWRSFAVGERFEDMPDYPYAVWAAQGYREAFRGRQPVFEDISAAVELPGSRRLLLTYQRAILPLGRGDRPSLLLGATLNQRMSRLGV